jgi:hypothetical protein
MRHTGLRVFVVIAVPALFTFVADRARAACEAPPRPEQLCGVGSTAIAATIEPDGRVRIERVLGVPLDGIVVDAVVAIETPFEPPLVAPTEGPAFFVLVDAQTAGFAGAIIEGGVAVGDFGAPTPRVPLEYAFAASVDADVGRCVEVVLNTVDPPVSLSCDDTPEIPRAPASCAQVATSTSLGLSVLALLRRRRPARR